ncbi:GNAT family N-acetyltransferase [uncultured Ilyobacter sp.]|uniref:GNAT family N-acetyltransferase n=1 Tax=uncultured Ilyobacter sp. TaxID=544433 RepID=UPI002AA8FB58|nr:GNAT family N-acetyltransferase [uncultured Ilyobacter sp.]
MLKLVKMKQNEYDVIKGKLISDYAKEKVRVGHWQEDEAIELSKETLEKILKDGVDTSNHYLMSAYEDEEKKIGFIWFNIFNKSVFINALCIYDEFKGNDYEIKVVEALEEKSYDYGAKKINLHSFGYNEGAIASYRKMGYEITDVYMNKKI